MAIATYSPTPWPRRATVTLLVTAHLLAVLIASLISVDQVAVSSAILFAVVASQTNLLGMWGGLGNAPLLLRAVVVAAGNLLLYFALAHGIDYHDVLVFVFVSVSTSVATLLGWLARVFLAKIRLHQDGGEIGEGSQFTIGQLMTLMTVAALLLTVARYLLPLAGPLSSVSEVATLGLCYTCSGLTSCWAMLLLTKPWTRLAIAVAVAALAGVIAGYSQSGPRYVAFWLSSVLAHTALVMITLAPLRYIGYRLVPKGRLAP